jgi:hypothetical protein
MARTWLAVALVLCLLQPATAQSKARSGQPPASPLRPDETRDGVLLRPHFVEVGGGRRMNLECIGTGSPTVVFDQGWGGTILDWLKVQAPISALTRTCFYDRAGMGWSPPSGRPSTPLNVSDDLHAFAQGSSPWPGRPSGPLAGRTLRHPLCGPISG